MVVFETRVLYIPGWPGTCYVGQAGLCAQRDPPAPSSCVLGLKMCTITLNLLLFLQEPLDVPSGICTALACALQLLTVPVSVPLLITSFSSPPPVGSGAVLNYLWVWVFCFHIYLWTTCVPAALGGLWNWSHR